jgi:hypothetical protein
VWSIGYHTISGVVKGQEQRKIHEVGCKGGDEVILGMHRNPLTPKVVETICDLVEVNI